MIYCFGHFVYIFETLQMANVCAQRMNTQNVYLVCVCACLFVFFNFIKYFLSVSYRKTFHSFNKYKANNSFYFFKGAVVQEITLNNKRCKGQ